MLREPGLPAVRDDSGPDGLRAAGRIPHPGEQREGRFRIAQGPVPRVVWDVEGRA